MSNALIRLDVQFCFAVNATARAVVQAYQPLLADLDLTYPQYLVMLVLWERDGISLKELGARLYLDSGTLTPLLKRLIAKGLARKDRAATDERELVLTLTAEGRRLEERAVKIPEGLLCRFNVPRERLAKMRDELKLILHAIHRGES